MKKFGANIALILTGLIIALVLAEIFTRVMITQNRLVTWIEMHPEGFMMNARELDALHLWRDRKNIYRLNNLGLRGDDIEQKTDEYRVLLIGDSFTFGLYLDEDHAISSYLSQFAIQSYHGSNIQFLNGGIGGAGLADWPGWLEEKGLHLQPDAILLLLNTGDTDRAISKNLWVLDETNSTLIKSQRWKPRSFFIYLGRQSWYRWLQEKSQIMNLIVRLAWEHLYFKDLTYNFNPEKSRVVIPDRENFSPQSGYSKNLSYKLIQKMQDWCNINQCEFILSTTGFFEENQTEPHTRVLYQSLLDENLSFPFHDNTNCILQKSNDSITSLRIQGTDHPDEKGALYIAECTWKWLEPYLFENLIKE